MPLPHQKISVIPDNEPDAVPSLWNTRYEEIDQNFDNLHSRLEARETELAQARGGNTSLDARLDGLEQSFASTGLTAPVAPISAWHYELQAELLRGLGQSGVYQTRSYHFGGDDAFDRPWSESFAPASIHNHPNFKGTPGMGEFTAVLNGYYVRTRHNDYRLKRPADVGSAFLATQDVDAPPVPAAIAGAGSVDAQIAALRGLFRDYQGGAFPGGFGWTLAYLEVWFEAYQETVSDTYDSFRHQQYVTTVGAALREVLKYNYGGYKNPTENVAFEPPVVRFLDESGRPVMARLRYRIAAVDVSELGDLRQALVPVDDWAQSARTGRAPARFKIPEAANGPGMLDALMQKVPGLDGTGAVLTESYGTAVIKEYGGAMPANAAYYRRFNTGATDAANRNNFRRGFNDPTLFVAMTSRSEVCPMTVSGQTWRFSYAMPLELILRTPLERWNPHAIAEVASVSGAGTQASPYSGVNGNARFYRVPAAFYGTEMSFTDPADTGGSAAYVTAGNGQAVQVRAAGIHVALPSIPGVGSVRCRYPIYPVFHEGSHAQGQVEAMRRELETARGLALSALDLGGTAHRQIEAMRQSRIQEGEFVLTNRGIVAGCTLAKSSTATRNLSLAGGRCFARGRLYSVAAELNAVSVPQNTGPGAVTVSAYLLLVGGAWMLATTPLGGAVPEGAIELYRLTIPAGSTDASDPHLASVVLTDVRRLEPAFPSHVSSPAYRYQNLNWLPDDRYQLRFDIVSAEGAPCDPDDILVGSRAQNAFAVSLASAADNIRVRWQATQLKF